MSLLFLSYSVCKNTITYHESQGMVVLNLQLLHSIRPLADCRTPEPAQPPRKNQFTALAAGGSAVQGTWNIIIITVQVNHHVNTLTETLLLRHHDAPHRGRPAPHHGGGGGGEEALGRQSPGSS